MRRPTANLLMCGCMVSFLQVNTDNGNRSSIIVNSKHVRSASVQVINTQRVTRLEMSNGPPLLVAQNLTTTIKKLNEGCRHTDS